MHLFKYLLAVFSLFSVLVSGSVIAERRPDINLPPLRYNYEILKEAAAEKGKSLDHSKSYALREYWKQEGQPSCYKHFTHAALVAGPIVEGSEGPEYHASQFQMFKDGGGSGGLHGGQTVPESNEAWWANHYLDGGRWVANNRRHRYEFAGEVDPSLNFDRIDQLGREYCRKHPVYDATTNSCQTFVKKMGKNIKE